MHRLSTGNVSLDASIIVDFHLTNNLPLFESLFAQRMLLSDFVEDEIAEAGIHLEGAEVVSLTTSEEWDSLNELRRRKPALGTGELGAITVARFRKALLLSNDKPARQAAEELNIGVHGSIGALEYSVEAGTLSGEEAVRILESMIREGAWIAEELLTLFRQKVLEGG